MENILILLIFILLLFVYFNKENFYYGNFIELTSTIDGTKAFCPSSEPIYTVIDRQCYKDFKTKLSPKETQDKKNKKNTFQELKSGKITGFFAQKF